MAIKKAAAAKTKTPAKTKKVKVVSAPPVAPKLITPEEKKTQEPAITLKDVQFVVPSVMNELQKIHDSNIQKENLQENEKISVVFPYLASAANGLELMYALRGWEENFKDFQIVIIGDRPDFISDQVIHIPHVATFDSPQLDVTAKLLQAIASELITEDFIFTNDDIYPVNYIELADISELKCAGFLGSTKKSANPKYMEKLLRTRDLLAIRKLPVYDYSTHTPYLFNKTRLAKVIERYKADQEPLLISSLYFNTCFKDEVPRVIKGGSAGDVIGYVYRSNPDINVLKEAFMSRKFINHNSEGYAAVLPLLESFFPDKCIYEI
jgi:hypothetical protein